jgi:PKD repeat protein
MRRTQGVLAVVVTGFVVSGCGMDEDHYMGFTATPAQPQTGQTVTFDGQASKVAGIKTISNDTKVAWDLDGNGTFETDAGTGDPALIVSRSYPEPGIYSVGLDLGIPVSDGLFSLAFGLVGIQFFTHEYDTRTLVVSAPPAAAGQNQPPIVSFTHDADPGYTKRAVKFDGTGSTDADGHVTSYEWNFGDKGAADNETKTTDPSVSHQFTAPGDYTVRLTVTDDRGGTAKTERMLQVVEGAPQTAPSGASLRAAASRGTPFTMTMIPTKTLDEGTLSMAGDAMVRGNAMARGRFTLARRLAAPLNGTRSPRWTAGFMIRQRGHGRAMHMTVEGAMLVDFGHGDRTCLGTRSTGGIGLKDAGRLTVLGGTGAAARLRGSGTFDSALKAKGPRIKGRLLFASTRRARPLPAECRRLARIARRGG